MHIFASALIKRRWAKELQVIESAKVPVIKFTSDPVRTSGPDDPYNNVLDDGRIRSSDLVSLHVDISFNEESTSRSPFFYCSSEGVFPHGGIAAAEIVKNYMNKMPQLKPLALVLKQLLFERNLNNTFNGGLGSYCLVLMIISSLQQMQKQNLLGSVSSDGRRDGSNSASFKKDSHANNLGFALIYFLDLYGKRFEYQTTGITIQNGGNHFTLLNWHFKYPPAPLVIVDPFNPTNNLGQQAKFILKVKEVFEEALTALTSPFHCGFTPAELLQRIIKKSKRNERCLPPQQIPFFQTSAAAVDMNTNVQHALHFRDTSNLDDRIKNGFLSSDEQHSSVSIGPIQQ